MSNKKFPEGFYWGAATASYQVEGGIENNDWAESARQGRVPVCGRACDHFNRYEQDFDIAKSLGHNAHRFSLEWARIEPEEGKFSEEAIEHYREVLRALRARNLEPFVTLWHFTLPQWFVEKGGFERKDSPQIFARYAKFVVEKLGSEFTHVSTMNEPMVFCSNGWRRGTWPPFKRFPLMDKITITNSGRQQDPQYLNAWTNILTMYRVRKHLALAHNEASRAMKSIRPELKVSVVKQVLLFHSNNNPLNRLLAKILNWDWTHRFMKRVVNDCDAIGLNYYIHKKFGDDRVYEKTDMDWDIYPEGILECLLLLKRYKKPIFISEAGCADEEDKFRADYIKTQVEAIWQAMQKGVDVQGHMYWSLLDNYEWALGFEKRFGLIEINYETLERKVRSSAYVYKEICERNAVVE